MATKAIMIGNSRRTPPGKRMQSNNQVLERPGRIIWQANDLNSDIHTSFKCGMSASRAVGIFVPLFISEGIVQDVPKNAPIKQTKTAIHNRLVNIPKWSKGVPKGP